MKKTVAFAMALAVFTGGAMTTDAAPAGGKVVIDVGVDPLPAAQAKLRAFGYTVDEPGVFGAATERAIRHWQRANRLAVTGVLDPSTLHTMGIEGADSSTASEPPAPVQVPAPAPVPAGNWKCPQYVPMLVANNLPVAFFDKVIWRESRCDPNAYNGRRRDRSYGLLQINMRGALGPQRMALCGLTAWADLFDPATNIGCAAQLYAIAGRRPWGG